MSKFGRVDRHYQNHIVMSPPLTVPSISSLPSTSSHAQPVRFLANEISISVSSPAGVGASAPSVPSAPLPSGPSPPPAPMRHIDSNQCNAPSTREQGVSVVPVVAEGMSLASAIHRLHGLILRRLFASWRWHARQRHWKKLAHAKDEQIMFLLSKLEESQSRGVAYCHRQRGRRLLASWSAFVEQRRAQRQAAANAIASSLARIQLHALQRWRDATRQSAAERRAAQHHSTSVLTACMAVWTQHAAASSQRVKNASTRQLRMAVYVWQYAARLKARETRAAQMAAASRAKLATSVFDEWRREAIRSRDLQGMDQAFARRAAVRLLARTLSSWHAAMHDRIACRLLEQGVFAIETVRSLLIDNRRLAKLVDASFSVNDQVSQLRAASDVNERLLRKVLALIERPYASPVTKRPGRTVVDDDCPDVFRRLASGGKRGRRVSREDVDDGEQDARIRAVKAAMSDDGHVAEVTSVGKPCKAGEKTWPKLGCLATTVVSVSEGEFFSLLRQVNAAFVEELGWTTAANPSL